MVLDFEKLHPHSKGVIEPRWDEISKKIYLFTKKMKIIILLTLLTLLLKI